MEVWGKCARTVQGLVADLEEVMGARGERATNNTANEVSKR